MIFTSIKIELSYILLRQILLWLSNLFFLLQSGHVNAQIVDNTVFFNLTEKEGLSSGYINCIMQDSTGYVWIGTENGLNRYDGKSFKVFQNIIGDSSSLPYNRILSLAQDQQNVIWIGTNIALASFDPQTEKFKKFRSPGNKDRSGHARGFGALISITSDNSGHLWIAADEGFACFSPIKGDYIEEYTAESISSLLGLSSELTIDVVAQDPFDPNMLWLGCNAGLVKFFKKEGKPEWAITGLSKAERLKAINSINFDNEGSIYYCGRNTTIRLLNRDGAFKDYKFLAEKSNIKFRSIVPVIAGKKCWLASDNLGFGELDLESGIYHFFSASDNFTSILPGESTALMKDQEDRIWIGLRTGISILDPKNQVFKTKYINEFLDSSSERFLTAAQAKGDSLLYLGIANRKGITIFNRNNNSFLNYSIETDQLFTIRDHYFDHENRLWVSSDQGLFIFDTQKRKFYKPPLVYPDKKDLIFFSLAGNGKGILCVETARPWGILLIDTKTYKSSFLTYVSNNPCSFPNLDQIRNIDMDRKNDILWIAGRPDIVKLDLKDTCFSIIPINDYTGYNEYGGKYLTTTRNGKVIIGYGAYGLSVYDPTSKSVQNFRVSDGLKGDRIFNIMEDHSGRVWVNTSSGLSSIDLDLRQVKNYGFSRGLRMDYFREIGALKLLGTNEIFIGDNNYFTIFNPDSIPINITPPITLFQSIIVHNADSLMEKIIGQYPSVSLPFDQNTFSISFAALNYTRPDQNNFHYTLEGFDKGWRSTSNGEAFYTNVRPGDYQFLLKAQNNDGIMGEQLSLSVQIKPPWWASPMAYVFYSTFLITSLISFYRFQLRKRLAESEALRLKELDVVKTQLYTNITHEFRTPLTVISGMADQIKSNPTAWMDRGVSLIKNNCLRLLNLINQMLDLAKLEAGSLSLNKVQGDIIQYLKYLTESFQSYAKIKGITLHFLSDLDTYIIDYDPDKTLNIISNLLSNAIKYTPENGNIYVQVNKVGNDENSKLIIIVKDTGIGIKPENLPHIFDRFYQIDASNIRKAEGTGIGLTLTRELTQMLGGTIKVSSKLGKGSIFKLLLPITNDAKEIELLDFKDIEKSVLPFSGNITSSVGAELITFNQSSLPSLLIIEDNLDVIQYLSSCLYEKFQVTVATDGLKGLEKAMEIIPDIIISDVMMPEKDGFEVCDTLKSEIKTSHIPIVLLTAKADMTSKIVGLKRGADAYISKPFHKEELLIVLENLLTIREKLRQRFLELRAYGGMNDGQETQMEVAFLKKVKNTVKSHLTDSDFDIVRLAREVGMSRAQLYRKIKALTGKSPSIFVRSIRLQRAESLLLTSDLNISEIAYEVGFSDPAFFSRVFNEAFSKSPSEFRKDASSEK